MQFDAGSMVPLYQQVADQLTSAIQSGIYAAGDQVPSTTEISRQYQLNPATVLKGMNLLVAGGLLEKRRGLGMFVTAGAHAQLQAAARQAFFAERLPELIQAAKELGISKDELSRALLAEEDK
ncbi:GntR family transcriptional regulator [Lacticaseibacillus sharpeae]